MTSEDPDTDHLIAQARQGDSAACQELLSRHRDLITMLVRDLSILADLDLAAP